MKCSACDGVGYQNLEGCPGAAGRCVDCEAATDNAVREAAQIIIAAFAPAHRGRQDYIDEASRIIRRELREAGLNVVRNI